MIDELKERAECEGEPSSAWCLKKQKGSRNFFRVAEIMKSK